MHDTAAVGTFSGQSPEPFVIKGTWGRNEPRHGYYAATFGTGNFGRRVTDVSVFDGQKHRSSFLEHDGASLENFRRKWQRAEVVHMSVFGKPIDFEELQARCAIAEGHTSSNLPSIVAAKRDRFSDNNEECGLPARGRASFREASAARSESTGCLATTKEQSFDSSRGLGQHNGQCDSATPQHRNGRSRTASAVRVKDIVQDEVHRILAAVGPSKASNKEFSRGDRRGNSSPQKESVRHRSASVLAGQRS